MRRDTRIGIVAEGVTRFDRLGTARDCAATALLGGFIEALAPLADRAPYSIDGMITWLLFIVTRFLAHVGYVARYVWNANVNGGRPFAGAVTAAPGNSFQMGVVAVITGLKVPHIDGRNGRCAQPFPEFLPQVVPLSVSI